MSVAELIECLKHYDRTAEVSVADKTHVETGCITQ